MAVNQMTHHQSGQGGAPTPRPPRKNPYRDGISKSNQQYDLYEAIRHPNRSKLDRPPISPSPFDKPLSKQKVLEKEVYEKFKKNNFSLPGRKLQVVSKLCKMLFLLFALPIYMVLFRLPKWIFVELIPAGLKKLNEYFTLIERRIINLFKSGCRHVIYPFTTLWKQLKFLSKKTKSSQQENNIQETGFFAFIAMGIWWIIKPIYASVLGGYKAAKFVYLFVKFLPKRIGDFVERINKKVNRVFLYLSKKVVACKKIFSLKSVKSYLSLKAKSIANYFKSLNSSIYKVCSSKINHYFRVINAYANHQVNRIKCSFVKVKKRFSSALYAIYLPFKTSVKAKDAQLRSWIKKWGERWKNWKFDPKLKTSVFKSYFNPLQKQIKERCLRLVSRLHNKVSQIWARIRRPFVLRIDKIVNFTRRKRKHLLLKCGHVGREVTGYSVNSLNHIKTKLQLSLKKNKPVLNVFKDISLFVNKGGAFITRKTRDKFQPFFRFLSIAASNVILNVRIMVAWTTIILRHGLVVLGQTAQEIGWF